MSVPVGRDGDRDHGEQTPVRHRITVGDTSARPTPNRSQKRFRDGHLGRGREDSHQVRRLDERHRREARPEGRVASPAKSRHDPRLMGANGQQSRPLVEVGRGPPCAWSRTRFWNGMTVAKPRAPIRATVTANVTEAGCGCATSPAPSNDRALREALDEEAGHPEHSPPGRVVESLHVPA